MKYLIFNCAVFLALGYLVMGKEAQDIPEKILHSLEKATPTIEQVTQQSHKPVSQPLPLQEALKKEVQKEVTKPIAPPPLPKAIKVVKKEPKNAPSRMGEETKGSVKTLNPAPVVQPDIVQTKSRRKQLHQMVADMEQMFAEKMIR